MWWIGFNINVNPSADCLKNQRLASYLKRTTNDPSHTGMSRRSKMK